MAQSKRRAPRSPVERARESADIATRKFERKYAQYVRAQREANRLEEEAAELKADADFLNSHPLLNGYEEEAD